MNSLHPAHKMAAMSLSQRSMLQYKALQTRAHLLPSPFLTSCTTVPMSFGGKGSHLRR